MTDFTPGGKSSSRRPDPTTSRLSTTRTLEVTPIEGNVWLDISHGIIVSTTALFPAEARTIAKALLAAADKAGGKPPKCRKLPASIRRESK